MAQYKSHYNSIGYIQLYYLILWKILFQPSCILDMYLTRYIMTLHNSNKSKNLVTYIYYFSSDNHYLNCNLKGNIDVFYILYKTCVFFVLSLYVTSWIIFFFTLLFELGDEILNCIVFSVFWGSLYKKWCSITACGSYFNQELTNTKSKARNLLSLCILYLYL